MTRPRPSRAGAPKKAPPKKAPPKKGEPEADARARILDAAEKAFADSGLAGARVANIATDAGVNKAMLYYYFGSKDELYEAVLERVFGQILAHARTTGALDPDAGFETLAPFIEGYAGVLEAHPAFVRLMLRGILDQGDAIIDRLVPRITQLVPFVAQKIARGQAEGKLNPGLEPLLVPPSIVAPILFFAVMHPMLAQVTGLPVPELRERWRHHIRALVTEGLLVREVP